MEGSRRRGDLCLLCWGKGVGGYLWEEVEVYLIYGDMCIRRFVDRLCLIDSNRFSNEFRGGDRRLIYLKKNSTRCSRATYILRYVARRDKDINSRRIEKSSGIERIGTRSTTGRSSDNGHRNRSNRVVSCKEF